MKRREFIKALAGISIVGIPAAAVVQASERKMFGMGRAPVLLKEWNVDIKPEGTPIVFDELMPQQHKETLFASLAEDFEDRVYGMGDSDESVPYPLEWRITDEMLED